ncbi:hypothetical protein Enr10x_03430 [Gimesia panareensis]|uniref:Calcineurin-like phosphoesterase domain-containing protein n=1 Tax=Gimesia panareensis TaxID=2527978 RepID=A0A517Q093_9PLAN|nr:metallophosphoesterase [Gimesia panareensis]QDT25049.1 hypothetical protein Enr10x_03430 [Gimesia panareensis]
MRLAALLLSLCLLPATVAAAEIERIWLTCNAPQPDRIVVNWQSDQPGDSVVHFGLSPEKLQTISQPGNTRLHHVEIPLTKQDTVYHYAVQTGNKKSSLATFKAFPTDVLRIAVAADWQSLPDLSHLRKDNVHLLLTAGDNIRNLWQACGPGNQDCIKPYMQLIGKYPQLFRSTPFMPVLGNHDREAHPRGKQPPEYAVYDVDATAFRSVFALPDDEWKWHFDIPEFDLRLIALDFNHTSDFGTTWQTCHPFDHDSAQYRWYAQLTRTNPAHTVTLYNERNATMRGKLKGDWQKLFQRGTLCITGFGYFAERAEVDGLTCYNTSLSGTGTRYPDPHSKFLASQDSYLLLTCERKTGAMTAELKNLNGEVLDRQTFTQKTRN